MAVPIIEQVGVDFLISAGGQIIGGRRGGTLTRAMNPIPVQSASSGYDDKNTDGSRSWTLAFDGLFLEGENELSGKNLAVRVAAEGGTPAALEAVTQAVLSLTAGTEPIVNTSSGFDQKVKAVSRSWGLSIDLDFRDPAGAGGTNQAVLHDAYEAGGVIDLELAFGTGVEYSGSGLVASLPLAIPNRGVARMSGISIVPRTALVPVGTVDVGLDALLDAHFGAAGPGELAVILKTSAEAAAATGRTRWTGAGILTQLTITIPITGEVTISGTITGSGALTASAEAAP